MLLRLIYRALQAKQRNIEKLNVSFPDSTKQGQNPETLAFICADSRIVVADLLGVLPGDVFIVRNVGNIIPPYEKDSKNSEAAAIEFALKNFDIKEIIICGHSDCGAMKGILTPNLEQQFPAVANFLQYAKPVADEIHKTHSCDSHEAKLSATIEANILAQIEHLKTYPIVQEKLAKKQLSIYGWHYDLKNGNVSIHHPSKGFILIEDFFIELKENKKQLIVSQIALDFLVKFINPKTIGDYLDVNKLFKELNENIEVIWQAIKVDVTLALWKELGYLYKDNNDPDFLSLVEQSSKTCLKIPPSFRKELEKSIGYEMYLKKMVGNSLFYRPNDYLEQETFLPRAKL